jgi:hypothetical protein
VETASGSSVGARPLPAAGPEVVASRKPAAIKATAKEWTLGMMFTPLRETNCLETSNDNIGNNDELL